MSFGNTAFSIGALSPYHNFCALFIRNQQFFCALGEFKLEKAKLPRMYRFAFE